MSQVVKLSCPVKHTRAIHPLIVEACRGKRVLNVGAAGGIMSYVPHRQAGWMHYEIGKVARSLLGVDISAEGIGYGKQHGITDIRNENCESMTLAETFDVIVFSDVIEHVDAPVVAINNLMRHLADDGKLIVTTPNPTEYGSVIRALMGRPPSVFYDHMTCFFPEHMQAMCNRCGYALEEILFFTHFDKRNSVFRLKSALGKLLSILSIRLSGSFAAIIRKNPQP